MCFKPAERRERVLDATRHLGLELCGRRAGLDQGDVHGREIDVGKVLDR